MKHAEQQVKEEPCHGQIDRLKTKEPIGPRPQQDILEAATLHE